MLRVDVDLQPVPPPPRKKDYPIGIVGAGFIVNDVQLVAYRKAGYNVRAIASAHPEHARHVAARHGIPKVYQSWRELAADPELEVLDVAVPPGEQPPILLELASSARHLKGVLAQKPLALNYAEAARIVDAFQQAGIVLAVNQNMRYDQSVRACKTLLERGELGQPVLATIEMRASPHWQPWCAAYGRMTLLIMSIHHLDTFRYWFGDPESVYVSVREDPRTAERWRHRDGIALYILEYANGLRAAAWDDVWAGPWKEGSGADVYIRWRVEGTEGIARGTIGWPAWPNAEPSTIDFTTRAANCWFSPRWKEVWFPDAFAATMGQLFDALACGTEPAVSGRDNLHTMALVEACYKSVEEHRPVRLEEILSGGVA
ncbi:MAG: Gfo/Idh/MocA family oxidoreductase [Bryobacterales bacterium]|nr:Gfo/Idh/MocA family oxidoreductase [Bryobacteraceae bacterium]MDW8355835.1 Gfo/Idh/MocA family oxidoreductase [Bryobacterales bacterium]